MNIDVTEQRQRDVPCPFCGLACDDLEVAAPERLRVAMNGCERSRRLFDVALPRAAGQAWVAGEAVPLARAVHEAAAILHRASQPAFAGLATDVAGMRAVLDLADRTGGVVDHLGSRALMRNMLPLQESGSVTATFAEVRNRADLIIVAGSDVVSRFPRFFERVAFGDAMFVQNDERDVVFIGENAALAAVTRAGGREARFIRCRNGSLAEIFSVLHGILAGSVAAHSDVDGVTFETLHELAERMRRARYGVLAWAAADLISVTPILPSRRCSRACAC